MKQLRKRYCKETFGIVWRGLVCQRPQSAETANDKLQLNTRPADWYYLVPLRAATHEGVVMLMQVGPEGSQIESSSEIRKHFRDGIF